MKKRHISLLAVALIVLSLCGTAFALINYYSVRDYQAGGKPSAEFEKHIVTLKQTYQNDYIQMVMGDAIFDGQTLAVAMNLYSKDESKPVYLYPQLTGYCGGREIAVEVMGMRGDFMSGFLYPNLLCGDELDSSYGFDAEPYDDVADQDVTWRFSVMVLVPNWPIDNDPTVLHSDGSDPSMEEYNQRFLNAYKQQRILSTDGESLVAYVAAVFPDSYGVVARDDPAYRSMGQQLVDCGAFTLVDTIECEFVTALPEAKRVGGQNFAFDDYTAELDFLEVSYLHADFALRHVYPAQAVPEDAVYYELRDQNGMPFLSVMSHSESLGDELVFSGTTEPTQNGVTAITFVPYTFGADAQGIMRNLYDDAHAFTVEIPDDQ